MRERLMRERGNQLTLWCHSGHHHWIHIHRSTHHAHIHGHHVSSSPTSSHTPSASEIIVVHHTTSSATWIKVVAKIIHWHVTAIESVTGKSSIVHGRWPGEVTIVVVSVLVVVSSVIIVATSTSEATAATSTIRCVIIVGRSCVWC